MPEPPKEVPPAPEGWNKTMDDLLAECEAGTRKSIGHPEMDWAIEYERRTGPPPPPEHVRLKWEAEAGKRGCYCSLWGTKPRAFAKEGLPEGYCGKCEKCGALGHTRHFPGPVPVTSAWCDKCYKVLKWTWPFRTPIGWVYLVGFVLVAAWLGGAAFQAIK
jgi:hypothetical protein